MRSTDRRRGRLLGLILLAILAAALGMAAAAAPPHAAAASSAARPCPPPRYPGLGYFTSLQVTGVTCSTGRRLAVAFYHCRLHGGGVAGRCRGRVDGFGCTELRHAIPTEIDARVTCRRGAQKVVHTYQQTT